MNYSAEGIEGSMLGSVGTFTYDNGTQGTFNVRYPDALIANNGSENIARYLSVTAHTIGGVSFEGVFPSGSSPGKLVYLGFPFETVYPVEARHGMMSAVLDYLLIAPSSIEESGLSIPDRFVLRQNFPNPFNPTTTLRYSVPELATIELAIYDIQGRLVKTLISEEYSAGWYETNWSGLDQSGNPVSTGMYFAKLQHGKMQQSIKMMYLK